MRIINCVAISLIFLTVNSCSSLGKKKTSYTQVSDEYSNSLPAFSSQPEVPKKTKDDFGVLEIKQDGPGYEINLALDTGDDNVNFTMDLPEQSSAAKQLDAQDELEQQAAKKPITTQVQNAAEIPVSDFGQNETVQETQALQEPLKTQTQMQQSLPKNTNQTGPSANDYLVSAQTQFYEDNYMGALEDIENAIKQDDTQALSYAIKGSILYKLGNKGAAKIAWEKALALNPKLASVELSLQYLVGQ